MADGAGVPAEVSGWRFSGEGTSWDRGRREEVSLWSATNVCVRRAMDWVVPHAPVVEWLLLLLLTRMPPTPSAACRARTETKMVQ